MKKNRIIEMKKMWILKKKSIKRLKSKTRKIIIGLIISLSALMFGYSLKEITSVPIATLVHEFWF